ncbi:MAG: type I secretion C-terminal target domain-containing protein [Rickettsiales bacterium]|nr:type I secretion C-terminal target domain-containing protein [Rickettsiales bacterium]
MSVTTYNGQSDVVLADLDGGVDKIIFDVPSNSYVSTEDTPHFIKDAYWTNNDYTIELHTGFSVTFQDQNGANPTEELSLNPTSPFLYEYAASGTNGNDWVAMDSAGTERARGGDDLIIGSQGNDSIVGGSGFDILLGMDGDDTIKGGNPTSNGFDRTHADGGDGNDLVIGHNADDWLNGSAGNDELRGRGGNDHLTGGSGDDTLKGGDGNDYMIGGSGNDRMLGQNNDDVLYGLDGNDRLNGGNGIDRLYGGADNDVLAGGGSHDELFGEDGDDRLNGGSGTDILYGGDGFDRLTGGTGSDVFVFQATAYNDVDVIRDFSVADNDKINIAQLMGGFDRFNDDINEYVRFTDNGTHSFLQVDADGGADGFVTIAKLNNITGLDAAIMFNDYDLLV